MAENVWPLFQISVIALFVYALQGPARYSQLPDKPQFIITANAALLGGVLIGRLDQNSHFLAM